MRSRSFKSGHGFTLVELLVVVSIIALLISILLPSLSKARESARAIQCAANQRQFVTANHMYSNDENGYFVSLWISDSEYNRLQWFRNPKYRSMMDQEEGTGSWNGSDWPEGLHCPSQPDLDTFPSPGWYRGRVHAWNWTGLHDEPEFAGWWAGGKGISAHRPSVRQSAETIAGGEANDWNMIKWKADWQNIYQVSGELAGHEGGAWNATMYRHQNQEAANLMFFDGHVETKHYTQVEGGSDVKWEIY